MKTVTKHLILACAFAGLCGQSDAMKRNQPDSGSEESESKKTRVDSNQTEQSPLPDDLFSDEAFQRDDQPTTETSTEDGSSSQPMDIETNTTEVAAASTNSLVAENIDDIVDEMVHQDENRHPMHMREYDESFNDEVIDAVEDGDTEALEDLLSRGANPNAIDSVNLSALMNAVMNQNAEIVRILLEAGAEVNNQDKEGGMPLIQAASLPNLEIVQLLIRHGADLQNQGREALINARLYNLLDNAQALVEAGINNTLDAQDNDGNTLLMRAIRHDNIVYAHELIAAGAQVNVKSNNGMTALMIAIRANKSELVRLLIDKGADVNLADNEGVTALMVAAAEGNIEIVQILLDASADFTAVDDEGYLAFNWTQGDNKDVIRAILKEKHQEIRNAAANEWQACPLDLINGPISDFLFGEQ